VAVSDGTGVDARGGVEDELTDAGDGVGVVDVDVSAPALLTVTLRSASFW
jgi:hypothetical protein